LGRGSQTWSSKVRRFKKYPELGIPNKEKLKATVYPIERKTKLNCRQKGEKSQHGEMAQSSRKNEKVKN